MRLVAFLGLVGVLLPANFADEGQCAGLPGGVLVVAQLAVEDAATVRALVLIVGVLVHLWKNNEMLSEQNTANIFIKCIIMWCLPLIIFFIICQPLQSCLPYDGVHHTQFFSEHNPKKILM